MGYNRAPLFPPVSLDVQARQFWALVGRNGSGKSTLLRTTLGLLPRVAGQIHWGQGARVGYVPQRNEVDLSVPSRVIDLVRAGVDRGWSFLRPGLREAEANSITRALADTDLNGLEQRSFASLSEGQKQRVLLARALVSDPQILVLDEPTSAMDFVAEEATFELLDRLKAERDMAVLIVTHHLPALAAHATHVIYVDMDDKTALCGPLAQVAAAEAFRLRYGNTLGLSSEASHG